MLRLGEAMSILALRTRLPSGNSPASCGEEVEIFFDGAVAIGAVFAGLGEGAAVLADLVGGEVVDVGFAGFDELQGPLVELREVVGGVAEALPLEAEPADVGLDGVDVLLLFFFGVGVVEAQVGLAAELVGEAEVDADGLGVADVEVAVGLGGKAGLDWASPYFLVRTSSAMMSRRKLEGSARAGGRGGPWRHRPLRDQLGWIVGGELLRGRRSRRRRGRRRAGA
jgi:hypothetical protein